MLTASVEKALVCDTFVFCVLQYRKRKKGLCEAGETRGSVISEDEFPRFEPDLRKQTNDTAHVLLNEKKKSNYARKARQIYKVPAEKNSS